MRRKPQEKTKNPREAAFSILNRVAGGAYADILLEEGLKDLPEIDRPLATELVYGTIRWRIRIDWIIGSFSRIKTKKLETKVLNALRLGVYQLLFLTRVPPRSAVDETVSLVRPLGTERAGFVNAVLRRIDAGRGGIVFPEFPDDPASRISIVHSHPEWMVRRWIERYGVEEAEGLCRANQTVPSKTLRVNTLIISREKLAKELEAEGFKEVKKTRCSPDGLEVIVAATGFNKKKLNPKDPRYYIQDEASQLIAYMVYPRPDEMILDACSAPGGKTAHMAALMENRGMICALDRYPGRLKSLNDVAGRFNIGIIRAASADAMEPPFRESFQEGFDAVLLDAPCSGLGVLRRSPDIKLKRSEEDITGLSQIQKKLIESLSRFVKRGGRLIYSVCTFEPEETDEVVDGFLKGHPDFMIEDASGALSGDCKALIDKKGVLRTFPHRHGMDGFFAARLARKR